MRLYHRTTAEAAELLLKDGFTDSTGTYLTEDSWSGVWLSNRPLDENEGACGEILLVIDLNIPEESLAEYEWIEEGKPYQEFLIPANLINTNSKVQVVNKDEIFFSQRIP